MHQEAMNTHSMEEALGSPNPELQQEKKLKPLPDQALKCPRCDSINTKFCYYNNYSLSQPRYFCKGCRRYWTQGGSLRNVPVGGGCRKNKRSSITSSSSSSTTSRRTQEQTLTTSTSPMLPSLQNPVLPYDRNDLTLAFARLQKSPTGSAQYDSLFAGNPNPGPVNHNTGPGFLDILRNGGFFDTRGTGGFHNLYYGFGIGGNVDEEAATVLPVGEVDGGAAATIMQESCKSLDGDGRAMMGMQYWQVGEDGNMGLESGRDYLGGVGPVSPSVWHGLVNSSLI